MRQSADSIIAGNIPRLMAQNCAWGHRPMFNRSDRNDKSGYDRDKRAEIAAMDKMSAVDDPPYMSPEEIAEEIRAMRLEKRAKGLT